MLIIRERYIGMMAKIQGVRSKQKIWSKVRYDGYKMHGIEITANEKGLLCQYVNKSHCFQSAYSRYINAFHGDILGDTNSNCDTSMLGRELCESSDACLCAGGVGDSLEGFTTLKPEPFAASGIY